MATVQRTNPLTLPSSGDLSAAQFKFVHINSSGQVVVVSSEGAASIGVLGNTPKAAGEEALVDSLNGSALLKVRAGAAVAAGDKIKSDGTGRAVPAVAASADHVLGFALNAAGAADVFVEFIPVTASVLA